MHDIKLSGKKVNRQGHGTKRIQEQDRSSGDTECLFSVSNHRGTKEDEAGEGHAEEGGHHCDECSAQWGRMRTSAASSALPTASKRCITLCGIQGKLQLSVWIKHPSLPDSARPSLVPECQCVHRLGKFKFWVCLIVCIRVPHERRRVARYNAIRRTNRVCVAIVAESRDRQGIGSNVEVCEVPAECNLFIWCNLEVGRRCRWWLSDR